MRALVVDDSVVFRRVVAEALERLGQTVVGTAINGRQGVDKARELKPDLITLDIEMPEMDGLAVLDALGKAGSDASVIVLSSLSLEAGGQTVRALERGAFDFIAKPVAATIEESRGLVLESLRPRVAAIARRREVRAILAGAGPRPSPDATAVPTPAAPTPATPTPQARGRALGRPDLVLIGVSTGGPNALARMLPGLPGDLGVPVLIVQHMPPLFTRSLADTLTAKCALGVREAQPGESLVPNTVYIAPGGRQMRVVGGSTGGTLQITDDPPENNCRPAVDYLFRSASIQYPGKSLAVVLTGMGSDGLAGLKLLKRDGCYAIAQDELSSVVYGMPRAIVEAGLADIVLPLDRIAAHITSRVRGEPRGEAG